MKNASDFARQNRYRLERIEARLKSSDCEAFYHDDLIAQIAARKLIAALEKGGA